METNTIQPIPYLFFDAKCADAMAFYADVFGGQVFAMTYGDMPGDEVCPDAAKNLIMNATLELPGGGLLYGSDIFPGRQIHSSTGFMVALVFKSVAEAQRVFDRLSENGEIAMPFGPTFWAEKFGMLMDKFGIEWAINGNMLERQ
ncbi:MAG: VOC family protein [Armatimonadetes bacterium]|nr:VOC family protein [Armatimonadota bacterium]